jgi:DNA-binding response OmpR family regulator
MATSPTAVQPPPSILIVDDDEMVLVGLSETLAREGYEVVIARGGYAAVDALSRHSFALVITDLMMPGLSGIGTGSRPKRASWSSPDIRHEPPPTKRSARERTSSC